MSDIQSIATAAVQIGPIVWAIWCGIVAVLLVVFGCVVSEVLRGPRQ